MSDDGLTKEQTNQVCTESMKFTQESFNHENEFRNDHDTIGNQGISKSLRVSQRGDPSKWDKSERPKTEHGKKKPKTQYTNMFKHNNEASRSVYLKALPVVSSKSSLFNKTKQ
jgi:hypothetical protein